MAMCVGPQSEHPSSVPLIQEGKKNTSQELHFIFQKYILIYCSILKIKTLLKDKSVCPITRYTSLKNCEVKNCYQFH